MSIDKIGEDFEQRPVFTGFKLILAIGMAAIVLGIIFGGIGWTLNWFSNAGKVAQEQFSAEAMLKKYEWFKDASAQLDAKAADVKVYNVKLQMLQEQYKGVPRQKWDRTDKEDMNQWAQEIAGIMASYNGLAAEYNAQMVKFNYRFTNAGDLPRGASQVLPREYRQYLEQ